MSINEHRVAWVGDHWECYCGHSTEPERSAGAAPLDVLREAFSDFDPCHECDNAEKAWAAYARLEGTDR